MGTGVVRRGLGWLENARELTGGKNPLSAVKSGQENRNTHAFFILCIKLKFLS